MPRDKTELSVFLSSPSDVAEERDCVGEVVGELNRMWKKQDLGLELIRWETDAIPAVGNDAQEALSKQLPDDYDIYMGVLWQRLGTPTARAQSGTEEEFRNAYSRYKDSPDAVRIMLYFKEAPLPYECDLKQVEAVRTFREEIKRQMGVFYRSYKDLDEFRGYIRIDLSDQLMEYWKRCGGQARGAAVAGEAICTHERVQPEAPPDEPRTKIASEAPEWEEEPGFLDYVEEGLDSFKRLQEVGDRMTEIMNDLSSKTEQRTAEMSAVQFSKGSADVRAAKRVTNQMAKDLEEFVSRTEAEIPLFSGHYGKAIDAYSGAASLLSDFRESDQPQIGQAADLVVKLREMFPPLKESIMSFIGVLDSLPRLTGPFRKAKRKAVVVLDHLVTEIEKCDELSRQTIKLLHSLE